MLDIDDTYYFVLRNNGHGKKSFKRILREILEVFESRVVIGLARDS